MSDLDFCGFRFDYTVLIQTSSMYRKKSAFASSFMSLRPVKLRQERQTFIWKAETNRDLLQMGLPQRPCL